MAWVSQQEPAELSADGGHLGGHRESFCKTSALICWNSNRLRQLLGRFVHSTLGAAELERLEPHADRAELESHAGGRRRSARLSGGVRQPQAATRGAAIRIRFDSIPDVSAILPVLRIEGAMLEPQQILDLTRLLEQAGEIRGHPECGGSENIRGCRRTRRGNCSTRGRSRASCAARFCRMRRSPTTPAWRCIACAATSSGSRGRSRFRWSGFLRSHHDDGTLQEDFITLRNDRFVVPVVAGQQRKVYGVIHGASGSGHTLFVEPLETIDLNNELVRLREEEQREVHPHPARVHGAAARARAGRSKSTVRGARAAGAAVRQGRFRARISIAPFRASAADSESPAGSERSAASAARGRVAAAAKSEWCRFR